MQVSQAGIDLIKSFEQLRLLAYQDGGGVWTIGWGHTGVDAAPGVSITPVRAEQLLASDIAMAEVAVKRALGPTVELAQAEYDALVSFTFNLGQGALMQSELLRRIRVHDTPRIAFEWMRWVHDDGNFVKGLARRRASELAMYLSA
jgi:lysozyme